MCGDSKLTDMKSDFASSFFVVCVSYDSIIMREVGGGVLVFFSSRRRHTRSSTVSWARRCV